MELAKRLKESVVRNLLNVKESELDKHYLSNSAGTFSRRELAQEIENETEVGLRQLESIMNLALYYLEKNK